MRVTVTLVLDLPAEEVSVKNIERCISEATSKFISLAWQRMVSVVEERAIKQHPNGGLVVKGWEKRSLWTSSGLVELKRRRFFSKADNCTLLLFDKRIGLHPWQRRTDLAEEIMAEAAAEIPGYKMAAKSLGRVWNHMPSPMLLWRAVQDIGRRQLASTLARRREIFEDGDLPSWQKQPPEFLAVEADGTYLSAWRRKGAGPEVQVGIAYTGKNQRGKRRSLKDKILCSGLTEAYLFGRDLFAAVQRKFNVVEVNQGMFLSDGAQALRSIREDHFPRLTPQLDWFHLNKKLDDAYGPKYKNRKTPVQKTLYAGLPAQAREMIQRDSRVITSRREKLHDLLTYLNGPGKDLYGARKLKNKDVKLPEHMNGSGAIERNVGTLVVHRMKRKGMGWTRRGAANLLAVRTKFLNRLNCS